MTCISEVTASGEDAAPPIRHTRSLQGHYWARLSALSRLEKLANLVLVTGIAHAADLKRLAVGELERAAAARIHAGAGAACLAKPLSDFRGVLLHITAADQARQHKVILRHRGR